MTAQLDGNGNIMRKPRIKAYKGVYKRRKAVIPPTKTIPNKRMMTLEQIQNAYQDSVLCQTTRKAKQNGAWYNASYCYDTMGDISECGHNEIYDMHESQM